MTQIFSENGNAVPVTIFDVSNNVVSKALKKDNKITHLEFGKDKKKKSNKADQGNYKELTFVPKYKRAFKVEETEGYEVGNELKADVFTVGDKVQVTGVTKGKGFASVIKRWKFAGGPRSHGASDRERAPGSLGTRTIPGRVFKGKKMGGHMGVTNKTITGLKVIRVLPEENLIAIKGSVPGFSNKSYLVIKQEK